MLNWTEVQERINHKDNFISECYTANSCPIYQWIKKGSFPPWWPPYLISYTHFSNWKIYWEFNIVRNSNALRSFFFLRNTILMQRWTKIRQGSPVDDGPLTNYLYNFVPKTIYIYSDILTFDTWHMRHEMWHMTGEGGEPSLKISVS